MSVIERYVKWFDQERDSNSKMLTMIGSVPDQAKQDERYSRVLTLAHHLAACRENWLDRMANGGQSQKEWWPEVADFASLAPRYSELERRWDDYLRGLDDESLVQDFEFPVGDTGRYRWNIEGQIQQLVGHSFYHRGQIVLLVGQLGGETVDTDYLYWAFEQEPERWCRIQ